MKIVKIDFEYFVAVEYETNKLVLAAFVYLSDAVTFLAAEKKKRYTSGEFLSIIDAKGIVK